MKLIKLLVFAFTCMILNSCFKSMSSTLSIANVVTPEVYTDYLIEKGIYSNRLIQSGAVSGNPEIQNALNGGGKLFHLPFWNPNAIIGADALPADQGETVDTTNISSGEMIARRQMRERGFSQYDIAQILAGAKKSPKQAVFDALDAFWSRNFGAVLFNTIKGVIAGNIANNGGDMVKDYTAIDDGLMSTTGIIKAFTLFGDQDDEVVALAVHSQVREAMRLANMISVVPDNEQGINWDVVLGKYKLIVDDSLVVTGTPNVYWSILFKAGAFALDQSFNNYVPTAVIRDETKSMGQESLYTRRVFALQPYGFAWNDPNGGLVADSPSNAELATAARWTRAVSSVKNTRFLAIKTLG